VHASPRDALTSGELRVAELAADGLTNREIAEKLYVTVRTVESHLSNAYRKLGAQTRTELAVQLR
jgi:DNA-binding NarL/FixJ family response regulator